MSLTGQTLDGKKRQVDLNYWVNHWPTPSVKGNYNRIGLSPTSGDGLATAVSKWPTPTARDYKDTGDLANVPTNGLLGRPVSPSRASGSLNPTWVEWLMGFPAEWTALKG
jgi:DNA (cytosine-5)-methyltransferase 1